jgi:pimeloyl-ACP methyl ester carboxylesterase
MRLVRLVPLVLVLAAAPPPAHGQRTPGRAARPAGDGARPEAKVSTADTLTMDSKILGRPRQAYVSLPASFAATARRYPVVIVLDGEADFEPAVMAWTTLARLGHVPEAIVVAIPNATDDPMDRVHDMTPPGLSVSGSSLHEGGDDFLDFIAKELLPEIDRRYRGGKPRILVGHSSGGVIVTWAAATRSDSFPVVVSVDAPVHLGDEWLEKRLLERAEKGGTAPVRYVSLESRFGWSDARWNELQAAAPPSWLLKREKLEGESHESMFFLATYQGLKFAFADYSIVGAPFFPEGTAMGVFDHYARIDDQFGVELPPPARVLRRLIEDLLTEGSMEPARRAMAWLTEGYGPQPDEKRLQAEFDRVAPLLPLKETVADLKAAPWPTPTQIAPWVGEWTGEQWMNADTHNALTLRIRVVDGKVEAETALADGPPPQRIEYLEVLPDGLEFGVMNGMRPAGMIVQTGHLHGNVLEGEGQFRGIVLPLPTGHMPPTTYFRLTRK